MTTFDIITWAIGAFITGLVCGHRFLPPRRNETQEHETRVWMDTAIAAHGRYIEATNPEAFQAWRNFARYYPPDVVLMTLHQESSGFGFDPTKEENHGTE